MAATVYSVISLGNPGNPVCVGHHTLPRDALSARCLHKPQVAPTPRRTRCRPTQDKRLATKSLRLASSTTSISLLVGTRQFRGCDVQRGVSHFYASTASDFDSLPRSPSAR
eukprot:329901-Pyramimonas_sp.AAC.1